MWKKIKDYKSFVVIIIFISLVITISYKNLQDKYQKNLMEFNSRLTEFKTRVKQLKEDSAELKEIKKSINTVSTDTKQQLLDSLSHLNPNVDPQIQEQIVVSLMTECEKQNLPPLLALCIIKDESNFNPLVKNSLNASGLMQVIPKYHQDKIDKHGWKSHEVFFIKNNILLGCEILRQYFNEQDNDIVKALQKYVGAIEKKNASKYIENIINNYISLDIIYFMGNVKVEKVEEEITQ